MSFVLHLFSVTYFACSDFFSTALDLILGPMKLPDVYEVTFVSLLCNQKIGLRAKLSTHWNLCHPKVLFANPKVNNMWKAVDGGHAGSSIVEVLDLCDQDVFLKVYSRVKCTRVMWVTLSVTNCTIKRLFSTVHRIKSSSRVSMLTGWLNSLSLLSIERELTENLNCTEIMESFEG